MLVFSNEEMWFSERTVSALFRVCRAAARGLPRGRGWAQAGRWQGAQLHTWNAAALCRWTNSYKRKGKRGATPHAPRGRSMQCPGRERWARHEPAVPAVLGAGRVTAIHCSWCLCQIHSRRGGVLFCIAQRLVLCSSRAFWGPRNLREVMPFLSACKPQQGRKW